MLLDRNNLPGRVAPRLACQCSIWSEEEERRTVMVALGRRQWTRRWRAGSGREDSDQGAAVAAVGYTPVSHTIATVHVLPVKGVERDRCSRASRYTWLRRRLG